MRLGLDRTRRVLDRGPDAGYQGDAEPDHRQDCRRLATEVSRYVSDFDADDQLAAGIAHVVTDHVRELGAWDGSVERDGSGAGAVVSCRQETHDGGTNRVGGHGRPGQT